MSKRINTNQDQVQAFADRQRKRFEDEMIAYLRREYAYALGRKDESWVRELVQTGISESGSYGFELETDVARYTELMVALSPDFDEHKKFAFAGEALSLEAVSPERKLDIIYENILFANADGEKTVDRTPKAPRPFHRTAALEADKRFRATHADLGDRPLTMDSGDEALREAWMLSYHCVLDDMPDASPTSRPYGVVGDPVADRTHEPTGSLRLRLVDEKSIEPVESASIQIKGPKTALGVSDFDGVLELADLPLGDYEVLAIDPLHRMATGKAVVRRGITELQLRCCKTSVRLSA